MIWQMGCKIKRLRTFTLDHLPELHAAPRLWFNHSLRDQKGSQGTLLGPHWPTQAKALQGTGHTLPSSAGAHGIWYLILPKSLIHEVPCGHKNIGSLAENPLLSRTGDVIALKVLLQEYMFHSTSEDKALALSRSVWDSLTKFDQIDAFAI